MINCQLKGYTYLKPVFHETGHRSLLDMIRDIEGFPRAGFIIRQQKIRDLTYVIFVEMKSLFKRH